MEILSLILIVFMQVAVPDSVVVTDTQAVQLSQADTLDQVPDSTASDSIAEVPPEEPGWWKRNEGTLLGSFLASLVATFSAFFAYWLSERRRRIIRLHIYSGLLYAIRSELNWHKSLSNGLRIHLNEILRILRVRGVIVVETPVEQFRTDYLNQCIMKILEQDRFNTSLLAYVSTYLNLLGYINANIDLSKAKEVLQYFDDPKKYVEASEGYFEKVFAELDKIDRAIPDLQEKIETEISASPYNVIIRSSDVDAI